MLSDNSIHLSRFGINNEDRAIQQLSKLFNDRKVHSGSKIEKAGLFISMKENYMAASPDRILRCSCPACGGSAIIEIKSWFKYRNAKIRDAVKRDRTLCLTIEQNSDNEYGRLVLKRNHPYYAQVQLQMNVCDINVCYFVVSTLVDIVCLRIPYNRSFCDELIAKSKLFVLRVILPELMGKFFTSPRTEPRTASEEKENSYMYLPCYCQQVKNDIMIHCANSSCLAKTYHRECLYTLGLKIFRKSWVCHICKKKNKKTRPRKPLRTLSNV